LWWLLPGRPAGSLISGMTALLSFPKSFAVIIMLAKRIEAVAPSMPTSIRRWFLERGYAPPSVEHQDWDLVLAKWDFMPLLTDYAKDAGNPIEKRFEAISALIVLQEFAYKSRESERMCIINRELRRLVLENRDFARQACNDWLGLLETLIVQKILGDEIPSDIPQWLRDTIAERA